MLPLRRPGKPMSSWIEEYTRSVGLSKDSKKHCSDILEQKSPELEKAAYVSPKDDPDIGPLVHVSLSENDLCAKYTSSDSKTGLHLPSILSQTDTIYKNSMNNGLGNIDLGVISLSQTPANLTMNYSVYSNSLSTLGERTGTSAGKVDMTEDVTIEKTEISPDDLPQNVTEVAKRIVTPGLESSEHLGLLPSKINNFCNTEELLEDSLSQPSVRLDCCGEVRQNEAVTSEGTDGKHSASCPKLARCDLTSNDRKLDFFVNSGYTNVKEFGKNPTEDSYYRLNIASLHTVNKSKYFMENTIYVSENNRSSPAERTKVTTVHSDRFSESTADTNAEKAYLKQSVRLYNASSSSESSVIFEEPPVAVPQMRLTSSLEKSPDHSASSNNAKVLYKQLSPASNMHSGFNKPEHSTDSRYIERDPQQLPDTEVDSASFRNIHNSSTVQAKSPDSKSSSRQDFWPSHQQVESHDEPISLQHSPSDMSRREEQNCPRQHHLSLNEQQQQLEHPEQQQKQLLQQSRQQFTHQQQQQKSIQQLTKQARINHSPVVIQGSPEAPSSTIDDALNNTERISPTGANKEPYKCQVCFDIASGFHYGVWTCEGCKAFFKRSLHGPVRYLCPANNNCTIDKLRRKSCQACRLRRCHECGMGASHTRRDSGARNTRKRDRQSVSEASVTGSEDAVGTPVLKKEKTSPRQSPSGNESEKPLTSDGSAGRRMLEHLLRIEPLTKSERGVSTMKNGRRLLITSLIEVTYEQLLNVIEWSKEISEFEKLGVLERTNILVNCWAEMVLIGTVWKSLAYPDGIALTPDLILTRESCEKAGIAWLYDRITPLKQTFRRLQVTHSEMVLLRLTIFLNAEIDATDKYDCLNEMRKDLNDAWTVLLGNSLSVTQRMSRLLPLLAHIRHCSLTFLGLLEEIRRNKVSVMPGLLSEMLDGDYETLLTISNAINMEHRALHVIV